ncbi:MAG TPA: hypothetical protein VIL81_01680, partial [Candidatus Limnocylindrales bacterium]
MGMLLVIARPTPLAPTKLSNRAAEFEDGGQGGCQAEFDRVGRQNVAHLFESQHVGPAPVWT